MKILILGTSNSILKNGWVLGLRTALPDAEITNHSVGASPGTQFGLNLSSGFTQYDAVLFDSVINDENQCASVGSEILLNRIVYEIISTISAQTAAIVLGFSNEMYLHSHSGMYTQRRRLAEICGAQFVGFHELVEKFGRKLLPQGETLFDSAGTHPNEAFQSFCGFLLGRFLAQAGPLLQRSPHAVDFSARFQSEHAGDMAAPGTLLTRASSITTRELLQLPPGASLSFRTAGTCLGLSIDAGATMALAAIDGPHGRRIKDLWYDPGAENLIVKFVPLRDGFPLHSLTVLAPGATPDAAAIEPSPHSTRGTDAPAGDIKLSFAAALFWSGQADDPLPTPSWPPERSLILHHGLEVMIEAHLQR